MRFSHSLRIIAWLVLQSSLLFLTCTTSGSDKDMGSQTFVSHSTVIAAVDDDQELCQAIRDSRHTLAQFRKAFERKEVRQVDFLVTVMRHAGRELLPIGILVDRLDDESYHGREVRNALLATPGNSVSCSADQVVDWRYADTFECVGGALYQTVFRRQPMPVQLRISENQPFLLEGHLMNEVNDEVAMDNEFRQLFRDIANLRHAVVEGRLKSNPDLRQRVGFIPTSDGPVVSRFVRMSVSQQAAAFSDDQMIELLDDLGVLRVDREKESLLVMAAAWGNVQTTRKMLELGFNPNIVNENDTSPLESAVSANELEVARILLKSGADVNRRDRRNKAPIFFASSVVMARLLVSAGARLNEVDDEGRSAAQYHLEHGREQIASALVECGAKRDSRWKRGMTEELVIAEGKRSLRDYLKATDIRALQDFDLAESVDFGCVLPLRSVVIRPSP